MKALGLIELLGYCPAVVALDTALKTADVSFQQISKIDKGIVSLTVTGDVAAVQAAMDAAKAAAEQVGQVLYVHVIPRPHDEVDAMLNPPPAAPQPPSAPEEPSGDGAEAEETEEASQESEEDEEDEPSAQDTAEPSADAKALLETLTPEVLEGMTVKELRTVARELNITNMTRKEIRFGKKEDLVSSICKYLEQEC